MIFSGPSYRTICQADGRWSHPVPRCLGQFSKIFSLFLLKYFLSSAPCVVPHISNGFVEDKASGSTVGEGTLSLSLFYSPLQVTARRSPSPVSTSSSPVTTGPSSAPTGPGPTSPAVSRPSAGSSPTPPGTGWWWPPTWSTGWWASSRWSLDCVPFLTVNGFHCVSSLSIKEKRQAYHADKLRHIFTFHYLLLPPDYEINSHLVGVVSVVTATCSREITPPSATSETGQGSLPGARKVRLGLV